MSSSRRNPPAPLPAPLISMTPSSPVQSESRSSSGLPCLPSAPLSSRPPLMTSSRPVALNPLFRLGPAGCLSCGFQTPEDYPVNSALEFVCPRRISNSTSPGQEFRLPKSTAKPAVSSFSLMKPVPQVKTQAPRPLLLFVSLPTLQITMSYHCCKTYLESIRFSPAAPTVGQATVTCI